MKVTCADMYAISALGVFLPAFTLQDLNKLQSAFTAKPWRQGCIPFLAFIFRTKAAAAYSTNQASTSIARPGRASKPALAVAALVAAEVRGCVSMESGEGRDSQCAADCNCSKAGVPHPRDGGNAVLTALSDEIEQGAVVVTVHVSGGGSEVCSSASSDAGCSTHSNA
jgi:hypothetical protein